MLAALLLKSIFLLLPLAADGNSDNLPAAVSWAAYTSSEPIFAAAATDAVTEPFFYSDAFTDMAADAATDDSAVGKMHTVVRGQRKMANISSTILSEDQLAERGATSVAQALTAVPGMQVMEGAKTGSEIYIRGFDARAALLMFDGIPISEVYGGGYDANNLLLEGINAIEVEKGVSSLLYGPGAMGGIIHLHSDPWHGPAGGKVELQLRELTSGQLPGFLVKAIAGLAFDHFSASVSFQSQKLGEFPLPKNFVNNEFNASFHQPECDGKSPCLRLGSDNNKHLLQTRMAFNKKRFRLSLLANYTWVERGVPPHESGRTARYWRYKDYNTGLIGLSAALKPKRGMGAGNFFFNANTYLMHHGDLLEDYQDGTYSELTTNPLAWFQKSGYKNYTVGLDFIPAVTLWRNNTLRTSYGFKINNSKQQEWTVPTADEASYQKPDQIYTAMNFHAALEDQQKIGPVTFWAGFSGSGQKVLREELQNQQRAVNERLIGGYEWRLAAQYEVAKPVQLVAGFGRKIRYPTLKELFSNVVGGNADLKPERALMVDFGGNFLFDKILPFAFTYKVRGFVSWAQDLIDKPGAIYLNVDKALVAGVENSLLIQPISWFSFDAGYTYLFAKDKTTDLPLDYRTPHYLTAAAKFMLFFGMDITLDLRFASRTESYYFNTVTGEYVLEAMKPYALVGLNIRQTFKGLNEKGSFYLFADMRNTFDVVYTIGGFAPQPGRQIFVGLGATF